MYGRLSIFILVAFSGLLCSGERISTSYSGAIQLAAAALQAHWKLDDLSTHYQNAVDEVSGQDGLLMGINSRDWDIGLDDAFAVDGFSMQATSGSADGYVLLPSAPFDAAWNGEGWSLDFWVRLHTLPSVLAESLGCGSPFIVEASTTGALNVLFGSTVAVSSGGVVSVGGWVYVTVDVTSAGALIISINGDEVGNAMLSNTPTSSGCSVAFGRNASAGTIFDEIALRNASSTLPYRRNIYDTGIALGCRSVPCFSGVSCTSNGATSYTCGSCPTGFAGDGKACKVSPELRAAHRLGNCLPTVSDLDNVFFCRNHCRSRRTCFLCGMYYSGPAMWAVRDACYVPSPTPSATVTPSTSVSSTTTPSVSASGSGTPSTTSSHTASASETVSVTLSTTLTQSPSTSATASLSPSATASVTPICYDWKQLGADIDGEASFDHSGEQVDINFAGDIVVIGARDNDGNGESSGHVRVFEYIGGNWIQKGADIDGEAAGDLSSHGVATNDVGNVIAIGGAENDGAGQNSGHVRVYEYIGGNWVQKGGDLDGETAGDKSGVSVSLNAAGDVVAIGDIVTNNAGQVRIFEYNMGSWLQKGANIVGDGGDRFISINAAGDVVAIGSLFHGGFSGRVRVFEFNGVSWVQRGHTILSESPGDWFGFSVSLNHAGDVLAVSGPFNSDNGGSSGHVRIFSYNGLSWVQKGLDIDGLAGEVSGRAVSLSGTGDIVGIGASSGGQSNEGLARVFQFVDSNWVQIGSDMIGENLGDGFGYHVSLDADGDTIAIGGKYNDGNGEDSGHVRVFALDVVTCSS